MTGSSSSSSSILRPLVQLRWFLAQPLQVRILPRCVPSMSAVPYIKHLPYLTIGQLLLILPLLILFFAGWGATFVHPSTEDSGNVAAYAIVATFLLANKSNSILNFLLGLSYERLVPYHNLSALLAVVLACFHGYVAFMLGGDSGDDGESDDDDDDDDRRGRHLSSGDDSRYSMIGPDTNLWRYLWDGQVNMSGSLIIACMLGLVATSFFRIFRHLNYDLWLLTHILLSVGVIVFCLLHSVVLAGFIILLWWLVDLFLRLVVMTQCRYPGRAILTKLTEDVVEIRLLSGNNNKNGEDCCPIHFQAGQFVRIAVQELGILQFHPVTISSASYETQVVLTFKVLGDWTQKLMELARSKQEINVLVEGPYGSHSMDLVNDERYPMVLCVGGGIGITPCRSTARQLLHEHVNQGRKLDKLQVVWSVREMELVRALPLFDSTAGGTALVTADLCGNGLSTRAADSSLRGVVQVDVFATRAGQDMEQAIFGQNIHRGRPDLLSILMNLQKEAADNGVARVAVIACGPSSLVEELKNLCRQQSASAFQCGGVTFDFHEDIFSY